MQGMSEDHDGDRGQHVDSYLGGLRGRHIEGTAAHPRCFLDFTPT